MPDTALIPLISAEQIRQRVARLGEEISNDFSARPPLMIISVLKGAFIFTADLIRAITIPCTVEFIRASSYGNRRTSSGSVSMDGSFDPGGRPVLLVEDIIDTGLTLTHIIEYITALGPLSLSVCTLLDKPSARQHPFTPDYTGFRIDNIFVVGYGLDEAERYRELPFIGTTA
ncbi:hypoxanthine phosphoribosyltransferase [Prosthecochloris sp. HL-130-GSB]|jgi:hypoxanthine phosphoribosyltransferase|uniref:hypoxanthine phosphoribosyltransferase n=1 Tax=Prosthecochloris sp. HL-130-GSB TaxID=1974213 RepID=UPI000A1C0E14|nr:hypoxanthine phosphoribosyltransferase [Prosthecochloris sp. HL-130-GSB]ARM30577.1 hypoxanthine phosphoribosyltransferase [Prosthecochloris sp. HL-130-GSB]